MSQVIEQVELRNCGPITRAQIPYMPDGGLVVLKGRQGIGKSTALEAMDAAVSGNGKPPIRRGEKSAQVDAFGVHMVVGRSTQRVGEPEVAYLGSKLSVADLVDPGIKSATAADAHRIKALVSLTGVQPSAELFYHLVGSRERFEELVSPKATEGDDLVAIAEKVKREFEAAARKAEDRAEHAEGRARGSREAAAGVDAKAECDPAQLQQALEAAIRTESDLKARAEAHDRASLAARRAQDELDDAQSDYSGPTLADAQEEEAKAKTEEQAAEQAVRKAEETLRAAKAVHEHARRDYSAAIAVRKSAEEHERMVAQWRQQIAAGIPEAVEPELLKQAAAASQAAREAVERGALVRKAREHLAEAEKQAQAGADHRAEGMALREAAKGIDIVLSDAVAKTGSPLRVVEGRLVVGDGADKRLFAELSDGERWKLGLDIAIDAIDAMGGRGFIVIPQWAWGELQPANKRLIAQHLQERGVCGYTAEATDDEELTAQIYAH
jgi:hypothetical protein